MKHFGKIAYSWLILFSLIFITLALTACRSQRVAAVSGHHFRDTTKMIVSTDTILLHDSIFTSLVSKNDTVFLTKSVTKYRYKVRQLHDTIAIIVRDSIPVYTTAPVVEQSKPSSKSSVFLEAFFGVVAGVVVVVIFALLIRKVS